MEKDTHLLTDLALDLGDHRIRPVYQVSDHQKKLPAGRGSMFDIRTISDRDNLRQAIIMRLLTPIGELAELGHPNYGSRLSNLVGSRNTDTTRNLVRLYILESLKQEARVGKVTRITVTPVERKPDMIAVELEVMPIANTSTIHIGPFTLLLG